MNTCKTCCHWTRHKDDPSEGDCASKKFVYEDAMPADGLKYWDYEGYSAGFNTGPDFGCIHHSPNAAHDGEKK